MCVCNTQWGEKRGGDEEQGEAKAPFFGGRLTCMSVKGRVKTLPDKIKAENLLSDAIKKGEGNCWGAFLFVKLVWWRNEGSAERDLNEKRVSEKGFSPINHKKAFFVGFLPALDGDEAVVIAQREDSEVAARKRKSSSASLIDEMSLANGTRVSLLFADEDEFLAPNTTAWSSTRVTSPRSKARLQNINLALLLGPSKSGTTSNSSLIAPQIFWMEETDSKMPNASFQELPLVPPPR